MSQPTPSPPLHPSLCFHPSSLRLFLRQSRSLIDDPISTTLNSLLTPSTTRPFDPSSTTSVLRPPPSSQRPIPSTTCNQFLNQVLYPSWRARSDLLRYCAAVATSPDPDDPDAVARELYNSLGEARTVDERLDPYSGRFERREARTEELKRVLREEEGVEGIVRRRTWGSVRGRCEGLSEEGGWEEGFEGWLRREQERERRS